MLNTEELQHVTKAVALYYDGESAPTLVAKGQGSVAEEILKIAEENQVPLCDNAPLVDLLSQLELNDSIPMSLYTAVATIIAYSYALQLDSDS